MENSSLDTTDYNVNIVKSRSTMKSVERRHKELIDLTQKNQDMTQQLKALVQQVRNSIDDKRLQIKFSALFEDD